MSRIAGWTLGSIGVAMLGLGACHHGPGSQEAKHGDNDRDEQTEEGHSPELGSGVSTFMAVRAIASARCEREDRCKNVGPDKAYASMDACHEKIKTDWADDLNKYECPKGVVHAELDECLNDIRAEDCGNPFDTLSRIVQCNASDICDGD